MGSIVPSMIKPSEFITSNLASYFVPCDGRDIPINSVYFTKIRKMNVSDDNKLRIPDLRGQFIRGLNFFDEVKGYRDDGNQEPGGNDRKPGDSQDDMYEEHEHGQKMAKWQDTEVGGKQRNNGGKDQHRDHWNPRYVSGEKKGGVETRPKNVAVYYYIKIN